jgi:uncharacterized protein (TIGR02246 family)
MNGAPSPFEGIVNAYRAAVLAKDTEAFVALYHDDVHVFDMWGSWSLRGIAAWRAMATDWFGSLGSETVVVDATEVESTHAGDLAFGHALLTFTAHASDGTVLRSLTNRVTMGLRREDGVWRVVHEHTSAPIEHASLKAILHPAS